MSLKITTWNVQNFERKDPNYSKKLDTLTAVLQNIKPDIAALQEILDPYALMDLANKVGLVPYTGSPDGRQNRVAFLVASHLQQLQHTQISNWKLPGGFQVKSVDKDLNIAVVGEMPRPAFEISFLYQGKKLHILTAHLKSKLLTYGDHFSTTDETLRAFTAFFALERRSAEATTLREHVSEYLHAGDNVILLGDLNDGPEAATTQILYGPPSSQPRGPEDAADKDCAFQRADKLDDLRLFNVTKLIPIDSRWTRKYNGEGELLDHILVSAGLMPVQNGLRQVPQISVLNADIPNMVGLHPREMKEFPDHAPVTAEFF